MKQRITVLGSTGSIGTNTLDVVARHPERFEVFALSAATQVDALLAQCARFAPRYAVMASPEHASALAEKCKQNGLVTQVLQAQDAMEIIASHPEVDMVMAAIVGAAGLAPCLAAARAGKRLLLANKEALVVGGEVFLQAVREGGATLLPIDSEHSAIFQSLPEDPSTWQRRVDKIILTASGGPFRQRDPKTLHEVTPEQACAHPNWVMGRKISVDSSTMMNKGLEVIEAHWLFNIPAERIQVVIHPESVIHSLVQYADGSVIAELGNPDMRTPIAHALAYPRRIAAGVAPLDLCAIGSLHFERPDLDRLPCLALAYRALRDGGSAPTTLNAANEVAVQAFLDGRIGFPAIPRVIAGVMDGLPAGKALGSLSEVLTADRLAREAAEQWLVQVARQ